MSRRPGPLIWIYYAIMPCCRSRWLEIQRRRKRPTAHNPIWGHIINDQYDLSVVPIYWKPLPSLVRLDESSWTFNTQFIVSFFACSCGWIKVYNTDNLHLCLLLSFFLPLFWCRATNKIKSSCFFFLLTPINIPSVRDTGMLLSLSVICLCFGIRLMMLY